jgi:hypothetical protein
MDLTGSGYVALAGFFEHNNEHSDSIKGDRQS